MGTFMFKNKVYEQGLVLKKLGLPYCLVKKKMERGQRIMAFSPKVKQALLLQSPVAHSWEAHRVKWEL